MFLLLLCSCGYSMGSVRSSGVSWPVRVRPVIGPGVDVDAPGMLESSLRLAIGRSPSMHMDENAEYELEVEVVQVTTPLASFSEPGLRAAQYIAQLSVRARLFGTGQKPLWSSPMIYAEAPYLSVPGQLEALDGSGRRALQQATEIAAERLVMATSVQMDSMASSAPTDKK